IGEVDAKTARDLFRTPALQPAAIPAMGLVLARPLRPLRASRSTARTAHAPRQPLLHVGAKPFVRDQLRHLGSPGATLRVPLRDRCLVLEPPRSRRRVPAKL